MRKHHRCAGDPPALMHVVVVKRLHREMVPSPIPFWIAFQAKLSGTAMSTVWNTTRNPLTRRIAFMLHGFSAHPRNVRHYRHPQGKVRKNDSK